VGEIAEDMVDGWSCSWCGVYFEQEHGHPVLCKDCFKEQMLDVDDVSEHLPCTQHDEL
jgi:hypothetical protein